MAIRETQVAGQALTRPDPNARETQVAGMVLARNQSAAVVVTQAVGMVLASVPADSPLRARAYIIE